MKNKLLIILLLVTTLIHAGEYEDYCYDNYHKLEAFTCLSKIKIKVKTKLDEKLASLTEIGKDYSSVQITNEDINISNHAFENYVEKQCALLSKLPNWTGLGIKMEDCVIKMMSNRTEELEYIFKEM